MASVATAPATMQSETPKAATAEVVKPTTSVPTVITTADEFRASRDLWMQRRYHVLTPVADFRALPPYYALMPAQVQVNPDITAGEVYADPLFCKDGEFALTKLGLSKIAMTAGMSIRTERTDDRRIQNLWEVKATARFIGIDGTPQDLDATEELDLRDGSERSKKVMGRNNAVGALTASRAKGLRNCEARAINAAIRQFGIKQKYTKDELAKPFVVLRVVFMPDMNDAETRRFITERALAGTTALYGAAVARQAAALPEPEHLDTIGVDPTTPPATTAKTPLLVLSVEPKSGTYKGRAWTVYRVTFSDGQFGSTFETTIATTAIKARDERIPVADLTIEPTDKGPNLTELVLASANTATVEEEPPLPMEGMKL